VKNDLDALERTVPVFISYGIQITCSSHFHNNSNGGGLMIYSL